MWSATVRLTDSQSMASSIIHTNRLIGSSRQGNGDHWSTGPGGNWALQNLLNHNLIFSDLLYSGNSWPIAEIGKSNLSPSYLKKTGRNILFEGINKTSVGYFI